MAQMQPIGSPLTEADRREVNKAIYILVQLIPLLDQAERSGIDIAELRERRDMLYRQATALKQGYWPELE